MSIAFKKYSNKDLIMNMLTIYNLLVTQDITEDQAAVSLGISTKELRFRLTRHGHKLPLILATLDKIANNTITRAEACEILALSPRGVNSMMASWKVKRSLTEDVLNRQVAKVKWEIYKKYAIDFIGGGGTIEDVAESAGISARQMRRWVADLLEEHFEMTYKEMIGLTDSRRRRLANEIEAAEGLEIAKQQVLKSIADGKMTLEEEATKRLLSKRAIRTPKRRGSSPNV